MDDTDFVIEVLTILLGEAPILLKELQDATVQGNAATVSEKAHKLKSSAAMINAVELKLILDNIEAIARDGVADCELSSVVANAIDQYRMVEIALKIHLQQLKGFV